MLSRDTWSNVIQLGFLGIIVLAVVLLFVAKDGAGEGHEAELGEYDPKKEAMVEELRKMFGVKPPDRKGEEEIAQEARGIIAIKEKRETNKKIPLKRLLELAQDMDRHVDRLADRTTNVEQAVGSFRYQGRIHFVLLLRPFDLHAHRMMARDGEDLYVSFLDEAGNRIAPVSAPDLVQTKDLKIAAIDGSALGWAAYGELPIAESTANKVARPAVGWIFSGGLHARLKRLQRSAQKPDDSVTDPFGLETEVGALVIGAGEKERSLLSGQEAGRE